MPDDPIIALLPKARRQWSRTDPVLHRVATEHPPGERPIGHHTAFAALTVSIIHQQVSMASGRAIWKRFQGVVDGKVNPGKVLSTNPDVLRSAGLSNQKRDYIVHIAEAFDEGTVTPRRFASMDDDTIIEQLVAIKGVGTWTAKMFLMFHLHRPDVVAPEDLGLRMGYAKLYGGSEKAAWKALETHAERWRPFNTVAARVLWDSTRQMEQATAGGKTQARA